MGINIRVQKPANHALVLGVMLRGFGLKKLDTLFAQSQRHFDTLLTKSQLGRGGKKVWNHLCLAQGFICVLYFRVHKLPFLCANSRMAPPAETKDIRVAKASGPDARTVADIMTRAAVMIEAAVLQK